MVGVTNKMAKVGGLCFVVGLGLTLGGCAGSSPDPAQLGRFRPTPAVNVILDSLGVADEPQVAWKNGEAPRPSDVIAARTDSTLQPGDTVRISIFELLQEGVTATSDYVVSETGRISIPEVGVVQAGGLTELQLEQEIKRILTPAILKNPLVSVSLVHSQERMFAVLGVGVTQPGRYAIPTPDFRLTDALAAAGGLGQFNVSNIYVSRQEESAPPVPPAGLELIGPQTNAPAPKPGQEPVIPPPAVGPSGVPQPSQPAEKFENQQEMLDLIRPSSKARPAPEDGRLKTENSDILSGPLWDHADVTASVLPGGFRLVTPSKPSGESVASREETVQSFAEFASGGAASGAKPSAGPDNAGADGWVFRDGQRVHVGAQGSAQKTEAPALTGPAQKPTEEQGEWVFRDGRWVQVRKGRTESAKPPLAGTPTAPRLPIETEKPAAESEWGRPTESRVIKIPADRLLAGDPRYNVIIKPGDVVHVPADIIGEFCITGNVLRSGYFSLTGRPMTLKQAIAAAGGLSPLAWPRYCEVVRRIGPKKEEIVMVDLDKIGRGEQPDFFIKPNDLINVGTCPSAQWRAAMRNAQTSACALTFVCDRNFTDADYRSRPRGGL